MHSKVLYEVLFWKTKAGTLRAYAFLVIHFPKEVFSEKIEYTLVDRESEKPSIEVRLATAWEWDEEEFTVEAETLYKKMFTLLDNKKFLCE